MRSFGSTILKGLLAILPIALTIYVVWALAVAAESLARDALMLLLPEGVYRPGVGVVCAIAVLYVAGLALNALIVRRVLLAGDELLEKIPVVKTLYVAIRDFTRFFPSGDAKSDLKRVVLVPLGGGTLIGFVTSEDTVDVVGAGADDVVAVYLPMSYMVGGYTLFIPRSQLLPTSLSVEAAMRLVLMGGVHTAAAKAAGLVPDQATAGTKQ